jgi:hypothetical protein
LKADAKLKRANLYLTEAQRLSRTGSFTWDVVTVHPEDAPILDDLRHRVRLAPDFDVEFRIVTATGVKHVHIVAHQTNDDPARPIFVGAVRDVTESKRAEEALKAREAEPRLTSLYLTEAQRLVGLAALPGTSRRTASGPRRCIASSMCRRRQGAA